MLSRTNKKMNVINKLAFKNRIFNLIHLSKRTFLTAEFKELAKLQSLSKHEINNYETLHKFSIEQPDLFWGTLARSRLDWFSDFKQVTTGSFTQSNDFRLKWFIDGKLNVTVNCVDRHYLNDPNRVALIWEKDEQGTEERMTYK